MSLKQQAQRQVCASDVEDSIQYLQRYLDDVGPNTQHRPRTLSLSCNSRGGIRASGVLPPSTPSSSYSASCYAAAREGRVAGLGMGHTSGTPMHTARGRITSPTRETFNDGGWQSSWGSEFHGQMSLFRRDEKPKRTELRSSLRESNGCAAASPRREPLRLSYTSTGSNSAGRPPLYQLHNQKQRKQQSYRQSGNIAQKRTGLGWRGVEDASLSPGEMGGQEWCVEGNDTSSLDGHGGSPDRSRQSYVDPYEAAATCRARTGDSFYRPKRSLSGNLLGGTDRYDYGEKGMEQEEGRRNRTSLSNNVSTAMPGASSVRRPTVADGYSPNGRKTATGADSLGEGVLNDDSSAFGNRACNENLADVFPYQAHEDNVRVIISYLKNKYALESEEYLRGIETMTPEDVLGLAQCFYVDVYRTVRHARIVAGVGRAGFTDGDPDMKCVVDSQSTCESRVNAQHDTRKVFVEEGREGVGKKGDKGCAVAPQSDTVTPRNRQCPTRATLPHASPSNKSPHARQGSLPPGRASPMSSAPDAANNVPSQHTSPLPNQLAEANRAIIRRPLKDLMPLLRRGSTLCKYVESGCPHMRFFRVEDRVGNHGGEDALMPHFVWYPGSASKRPNGVLPLLSLVGVHLLLADNFSRFSKLFRRKKGVVIDYNGRTVANDMCVVFRFKSRDVAVSFLAEEDRQIWVGGMMGIVERNREVAFQS